MQQSLKTHLFSKHNGQLDFLFRFAQVEIAAVGDGHAQLIEYAVRQLGRSRAGLVGDRPQLGGNLYQLAVWTIGVERQIGGAAGQIVHAEGHRGVGMHIADGCGIAPACNRTFAAVLCKLILCKHISCRLIEIDFAVRKLGQVDKAVLQAEQLQIAGRTVECISAVAGVHADGHIIVAVLVGNIHRKDSLACGADIVEINTIRKRLSAVKGGRFALACAPAAVYSVVLSDILGDPLDMIASGPACPDSSTCAQAAAIAEKYRLALSPAAAALLRQETPKTLPNVTTKITGSVRELCRAAADACRAEGYEPVLLTDCLCCEAREAGSLLGSIARTHAGQGRRRAFIAGGETVVHLTGHGLGGRNQELALAAAPALAGLRGCCVFSVGSDGTDGPTDAAGGYTDGEALAALTAAGLDVPRALADNDAYHALQAVGGLIMTGPTGTNVNDVAVVLTE